jgi:hypothetical protein
MGISIYVDDTSQAGRVIKKFGNARRLAEYMAQATGQKCDPSRVYRWMHPRDKGGCGGLIPSSAMVDVMKAARLAGIILSPAELFPDAKPEGEAA